MGARRGVLMHDDTFSRHASIAASIWASARDKSVLHFAHGSQLVYFATSILGSSFAVK